MAKGLRPSEANQAPHQPLMVADVKPDYPVDWLPGDPYPVHVILSRSFDPYELRLFEGREMYLEGFEYSTSLRATLTTHSVEIKDLDTERIKRFLADLSSMAVERRRQAADGKEEREEHFRRAYKSFRPDN